MNLTDLIEIAFLVLITGLWAWTAFVVRRDPPGRHRDCCRRRDHS